MAVRESFKDLSTGLLAPWRGLSFLAHRRASWRLAVVPIAIASALLFVLAATLLHVAFGWVDAVIAPTHGALLFLARAFLQFLAIVASLGVALYASLTLASPLSSAALDRLVRLYDNASGAPDAPQIPWAEGATRALLSALIGVAVAAPVAIAISLIDLIFPAASVVLVPVGMVVSGYVIAWNLLDYPLGLRGVTLRDRARWMGQHPALVTGFAVSASVLMLVPGLGLLLLPAGVVGAAMVVERGGVLALGSAHRNPPLLDR